MRQRQFPGADLILPLVVAACGVALLLADPVPVQTMRHGLFDQYQRWQPRAYQPAPVRIIDIDEDILNRLGQWPWPRTRLAELVEKLESAGVAAIGFDVVFAEKDRTSPQSVADQWSLKGTLRQALEALPDHDEVFAERIRHSRVVLGFAPERTASASTESSPPEKTARSLPQPSPRPFRYITVGSSPATDLARFDSAIYPLPLLAHAAQGLGALSFLPDSDGIVRRVPLALRIAEQPVPTLGAELLRVAQGTQNYVLRTEENSGLSEIRIGELTVPTTTGGEMWVHYSASLPARYLPAWKVLSGAADRTLLGNHLVLIGTSAQVLMDLRHTPHGRIVAGVEVHAQALEQILSGHFLQRPPWARAAEALSTLLGVVFVGLLALRGKALVAALGSALCLAGLMFGGWQAFKTHGLLLDTVTPALMIALCFVLCSLIHHFINERKHRWIKDAFSRYVSPNRVAHLVANPEAMELGGHRQECSFIFTDLADFTRLMENIDPAHAVSILNTYLDEMIGIAFRHEGTLDRIVGDAVAIMFSAPVQQPDHRNRAMACAMEMHAFACRYAADLQARGIDFGKTRIGIHSGEVIVGNFGGSTMFDYRALGDPVNTASRLENENKALGTSLCLSEKTLSGGEPPFAVRPAGKLILKGKTQALQVYEAVTEEGQPNQAPQEGYLAAYQLMSSEDAESQTGQPQQALRLFNELAARYPNDPLVRFHQQRLSAGQRGDIIRMTKY